MRIAVSSDERTGVADAVVEAAARARPRARARTARWPTASAPTGRGRARPPRATSPTAAPTRASSAAGPARARRSPRTRSPGIRAALCGDAQTAEGARKWNDANVLALSLRTTSRGRARGDPRRLVRRRAVARGRRPREHRAPGRDRGLTLAERVADRVVPLDRARPGEVTPGLVRHARAASTRSRCPRDLAGKRCLDVGTWDGFWAFEMERRGAADGRRDRHRRPRRAGTGRRASACGERHGLEVLRRGQGARRGLRASRTSALGSRVERRDLSVYDLDPDERRHFDVVFLGSLLLHLRDPVARARARARRSARASAVIADTVELLPVAAAGRARRSRGWRASTRPWWWQPNRAGAAADGRAAPASRSSTATRRVLRADRRGPPARAAPLAAAQARSAPQGREEVVVALKGVPHVAVRARPALPPAGPRGRRARRSAASAGCGGPRRPANARSTSARPSWKCSQPS